MDNCPFCGYTMGGWKKKLAIQAALLEECLEVVRAKILENPWPPERGIASGCQFCGKPRPQPFSNADEHYGNCPWVKANALLTKLEAATEATDG